MLSRMDEFGRPAWVLATVVAFWLFWPLGVATLAYLAWTGRLAGVAGSRMGTGPGQWFNLRGDEKRAGSPSGNKAFDDYRAETIRRLEEEQREFRDYLERLRRARDKSEFDGFMAERRRTGTSREPGQTEQV